MDVNSVLEVFKFNTAYLTEEVSDIYGKTISETLNELEAELEKGNLRAVPFNSKTYWSKNK